MSLHGYLNRRSALALLATIALPSFVFAQSSEKAKITIYKDPNCSCCGNWQRYMLGAGFTSTVKETMNMASLKTQLGVPNDLASCHTAVITDYVIEGHVPAAAVNRLLIEKPIATGLAVAGMPAGAPGMGGSNDPYEVILFGPSGRRSFMRFVGDHEV